MKNKLFSAYKYLKTKLFTASIFFTLAVIVFGAITYIELPCPVCGGTGYVTGVGDLEIIDVEYELIEHHVVGLECGWDWERYTYDIKITVENKAITPLYGMIQFTFHDPEESRTREVEGAVQETDDEETFVTDIGAVIWADTIFVDGIDAGAERTIEETIVFEALTLELFDIKIHQIEVNTKDKFICPVHGETNKVSVTEWLRLR